MSEKQVQDFKLAVLTAILASIIPTTGAVWAGAQFVANASNTKETVDKILNRLDSIESKFHQTNMNKAIEHGKFDGRILRLETIMRQPDRAYAKNPSQFGGVSDSNGG